MTYFFHFPAITDTNDYVDEYGNFSSTKLIKYTCFEIKRQQYYMPDKTKRSSIVNKINLATRNRTT